MTALAIRLTGLGGISPRTSPRLLPETGAIEATNVKLYSGELVPLRDVGNLYDPAKTGPFVSIFKARNGASSEAWFTWNVDVDCVRVPLAVDVESRFCWTGDGPPKMAKYSTATAGAGDNYPVTASEVMLGIPNPQVAPTVGITAGPGAGSTVTRFYCYTYFSADGEESGPSPISLTKSGKTDDQWDIAAMDAAPLNSGTGTCTNNIFTAAAAHWLRVGDLVTVNSIQRTVTEINGLAFTFDGATATGSTTWARVTPWNTTGMTKRLYRTSGSLGAFQLVAENLAIGTATYSDTLGDAQILGDELISEGWEPPPVGLKGLMVHPSGAVVGFVGNLLCLSEPLQPHAFITSNQLAADADIVGIAGYNSEVVVATKGVPHLASGVEPASMTMDKLNGMYPCLSKRSVISVGDGVLYATQHGLAYVGQGGVKMFTEQWVTKEEWRFYQPSTMISATANGRVYVNFTQADTTSKTMVFEDGQMTTISLVAYELYTDPATGTLYLGMTDGIYEWDSPDAYPLSMTWRSKDFYYPTPMNLGAAKLNYELAIDPKTAAAIVALRTSLSISNAALIAANQINASYGDYGYGLTEVGGDALEPVPAAPPSNEVTFALYVGHDLHYSRIVTDTNAFRLPAGSKYFDFGVQVSSQCKIQSVVIGETMESLKTV